MGTQEQPPELPPCCPHSSPGQGDAKSATAEEPKRGPVGAGVWSINK